MSATWIDHLVEDSDSLQTLAIKFDVAISALKKKNRISDSSDLWPGRIISVPQVEFHPVNHDDNDETPETVGFIKLDAYRIHQDAERTLSLSEIDLDQDCICGVLLITPCALMFDPTNPNPDDGLILPMAEVKRAALYNSPSKNVKSWLQVSGKTQVAYFSVSSVETGPLLSCLQKWSPAKHVATPALKLPVQTKDQRTADVAVVNSASYLETNEDFFSSAEKSWQIESYSEFDQEWTQLNASDLDPDMIDEIPDMTCSSDILSIQQVAVLNQLLPARCIGAKWILKYSSRNHGTSIGTLYRRAAMTSTPNLIAIKTLCGSTIGALASHPLKVQEHFFGSGETFLYRFKKSNSANDFAQYPWSGKNNFFMRCEKDQLIFGSSEGSYAIWIPGTLLRGTSKPCETFMNPILTSAKDFQIADIELWSFSE